MVERVLLLGGVLILLGGMIPMSTCYWCLCSLFLHIDGVDVCNYLSLVRLPSAYPLSNQAANCVARPTITTLESKESSLFSPPPKSPDNFCMVTRQLLKVPLPYSGPGTVAPSLFVCNQVARSRIEGRSDFRSRHLTTWMHS